MLSRLASCDLDSLFSRKKRLVADPEVTVAKVEAEIDAYLAEVGNRDLLGMLNGMKEHKRCSRGNRGSPGNRSNRGSRGNLIAVNGIAINKNENIIIIIRMNTSTVPVAVSIPVPVPYPQTLI